ncbi:MAG TPA: protein kinase [Kofleriaceae bacterium]|nr:protein kinase [Kofleriaceae bacterium]
MAVGGDDDTLASSEPTSMGASNSTTTGVAQSEVVAGRYKIVRWLGGGGMGRVYEALDTELDEKVALKVLKTGLSDDALERFRREVKLTRRIQHRNVARMFDIGEHKGEKFLTMELVEGDPLTREISETPMGWTRLRSIAQQICEGLAAAHAAGVIHRDLKPDNVLIERGTDRAVLTDFGIARGQEDPGVTQVGAVVGTPRYMSPEQLNGRELDARSDLFSLGVMLFELATGLRPWPGDNAVAIAVSQATTAPRTIDTTQATLPGYFASIVTACLQMDPRDRPASAAEIAAALVDERPVLVARDNATRVAKPSNAPPIVKPAKKPNAVHEPASATLAEPTSVAVLPLTCAPADEYLADGLLEDLTDTLSTTPGIRVRPPGFVRGAGGGDPREHGQHLQVDHVVVGTVRRVPTGLRITTRLISVADGFQIWAHKTDCSEADVLSVASELAHGIAQALSTRASSSTRPTDPRAVDFYLRARAELRRFWGSHAQTAADLLEQAVEDAPTSAPIRGAYAYACVQAWVMRSEGELLPRAREAIDRALVLGHGEAFLASAQLHFNLGDSEKGAAELARALVRAPMSAQSHELAGKILIEIEGAAQARQHYETARGLDPGRGLIIDNDLARLDALERKWVEADRRVALLSNDPDTSIAQLGHIANARLSAWRGRMDVLSDTATTFLSRVSSNANSIFRVIIQIQSDRRISEPIWNAAVRAPLPPDRPVRQFMMRLQIFCEVAALLDQRDYALEALTRVVDLGLMDVAWMDNCPLLEKLVELPGYPTLRRRVGERASRVLSAFRGASTA